MKQIALLILLVISTALHAQRDKAEAYVAKYKDLAIAEMQRTGIPASITIAQGILESQYGESDLAKNANKPIMMMILKKNVSEYMLLQRILIKTTLIF